MPRSLVPVGSAVSWDNVRIEATTGLALSSQNEITTEKGGIAGVSSSSMEKIAAALAPRVR